MKNFLLKFFSVFVILLFCLSPLVAIDLEQGVNLTHANENNCTDINEVNGTIKVNDSDVEIKGVNGTVVDKKINGVNDTAADFNNETTVEIQNMSSNDTNSTLMLNGEKLGLRIKVDDVHCGERAIMKVWVDNEDFNYADFKLSVTGPNYSKDYKIIFYQGFDKVELEDLPAGTYIVTLTFSDEPYNYFDSETARDYFTVYKKKTDLNAHIDNINFGDKPVVKFTSSDDLEGNITISSPKFSKDYKLPASKGSFDYELDGDLAPGQYYCTIYYSGDEIHDSGIFSCYFDVNKYDPDLSISIGDIHVGENPVVKIKANKSLNGNVMVRFRDENGLYYGSREVPVVDGVGELTVINSYLIGEHSATAIFYGDDTFSPSEKSTKFTVN